MLQKFLVIFLYLERSLSQNHFYLSVVQRLFLENFFRKCLYFVLVATGQHSSFGSSQVYHPHYLLIKFGVGVLAENVFPLGLHWCVVREVLAHAEPQDHRSSQVPHFLKVVGSPTRYLSVLLITSLKNSS